MKKYIPVRLEAEIDIIEGSEELRKAVASIVKFPENKTPDMLFFSGIFVSSGENLNRAFFLPSELVKAFHTIDNKALDIEHDEMRIVGHIYSSAFVDHGGNKLDVAELKKVPEAQLNSMNLDIMIAGILYSSRFPELATEVKDKKWKLSMETYFQNFDVKIGNLILTQKEAEVLGLTADSILGRLARVFKKGQEIAKGSVARVLRELLFSGCGLVKQPANPRSLILEVATKRGAGMSKDEIIINLDDPDGSRARAADLQFNSPVDVAPGPGALEDRTQTSPGLCVSYKRRVIDATFEGPDSKILHEDWCALYERGCTSPSRGADNPTCLRNVIPDEAKRIVAHRLDEIDKKDNRSGLLKQLQEVLGA